eukprot:COSAG01_NODE_8856_length_2636_cov_3.298384_6_plen_90_part_01
MAPASPPRAGIIRNYHALLCHRLTDYNTYTYTVPLTTTVHSYPTGVVHGQQPDFLLPAFALLEAYITSHPQISPPSTTPSASAAIPPRSS